LGSHAGVSLFYQALSVSERKEAATKAITLSLI
jgi:hypothetical protein